MAKLIAMYKRPADPAAFERYYFANHVPLAKTVPGLVSYEVTRGPIMGLDGPAEYHLIATLTFSSMAAIRAALTSSQGQAVAADLANFAMAGVAIVFADSTTI
jgi:uncharacterized protein (TIGR02118 family)